jgi:hypothetical protein
MQIHPADRFSLDKSIYDSQRLGWRSSQLRSMTTTGDGLRSFRICFTEDIRGQPAAALGVPSSVGANEV